ncbi:phenylalanine--tRNA ligase subunit beta [bacterium C-53]|nr:phenylalanine--tRNA ligase subunit beta [Lachnospiraceae bacterium]NBI01813.1 phenylalanine--tRNA ligase subunit beta [Lachnospiraceae bacterium]RKJ12228.1 phenylalanine--tRNA ligase subunit beta [bacterium C-53]
MNTALSWIKAYVPDLSCTDQEYTDAMTLTGTKVETFERLDKNLEKIYVGQILSIEKHPDADKLIVCQLDMGNAVEGGRLQIVTGAPNVKVGDKVPVVIDGGKVAGGHDGGPLPENGIKIKSGKLRGIESFGMMCSIEELGSSKDMYPDAPENGIYILPESAEVGADAVEALGLHDTVFEYEITSNRVDCYSVLGIAREAAVTFDQPFYAPEVVVKENEQKTADFISVEVEDQDLCTRYCARICTNIKIAPSPEWMQRRLAASGIRPINNLVDITNYVMEEYGQPMHAYDLDTIAGHKIVVKRAKDGDTFLTLDGQERTLDHDMLMINDAEKAIGIAGIMGGENSKITDDVKTVLFEAACFNGANIRKSAKRLGLRTEASGKFEKGLDAKNALDAINRACQLIQELGCGEVTQGVVDVCCELQPEREIEFRPVRINELLGTDLSAELMLSIFEKLGLGYKKEENMVVIPSFRQDLEGIADLAEEVARFYGYDKIPSTLPSGEATTGKLSFKLRIEQKAREIAEFCGFSQAMSYSFESPKVFDKLLLSQEDPARNAIVISNPLGEDFSIMRTVSLNGMLTSLATNYNRRNKDVRLYEFGNIYLAKSLPLTELPDERMQFTLGFYGDGDFFTMKGVIEEFFDVIGLKKKAVYDPKSGKNFLHPGRQANVIYDGVTVGFLGEVHPDVCDHYGIGTKAYVAVLDMPEIVARASFDRKYAGVAKFPSVSRDISMVMPKSILVGQIEEIIEQRGGKNLESYSLFDIYEGSQIKEGHKSVAYTVVFRNKERTLEEADINAAMKKILNGLEGLGIELRS